MHEHSDPTNVFRAEVKHIPYLDVLGRVVPRACGEVVDSEYVNAALTQVANQVSPDESCGTRDQNGP
jgi:hypothetical protein